MKAIACHIARIRERESNRSGAIELSYSNLFWIFFIMSMAGLIAEVAVSFVLDGRLESRAGLVFGPLSPIYGVGAVLVTAALNRLADRPPIVIFAVAGITGAFFEYVAGWFWESAFGIVAWSYSGHFLNLGGHTSLLMACVWGICGLAWMKAGLPFVMRIIGYIPQTVFKNLTVALSILVFADIAVTVMALDCWYLRASGVEPGNPFQIFFATFFGDDFMEARFETMSMWTSLAWR